jgi:hypothetical protein
MSEKRSRSLGNSRNQVLRDLWLSCGCPERMTVQDRSAGETILLINGFRRSPVTLSAKNNALLMQGSDAKKRGSIVRQPVTLTQVCEHCLKQFESRRKTARFCSPTCRKRAARNRRASVEAERLLAEAFQS